ncbi:MAG: hypothetical protein ABJH63_20135 [Rhizobiaceae bacterium]
MTVTASNFDRKANDFYQTEPWATEALLRNIDVRNRNVWEPAAGNHMIADVLTESGAKVITSDIEVYDKQHHYSEPVDFLTSEHIGFPSGLNAIITNPPYGRGNRAAVKFIEAALERCDGLVAMLLTAKFDFGKTRRHLFADNPRYQMKIALLDRLSLTLDGNTGTEDHAWYVWDRPSTTPAELRYEAKLLDVA